MSLQDLRIYIADGMSTASGLRSWAGTLLDRLRDGLPLEHSSHSSEIPERSLTLMRRMRFVEAALGQMSLEHVRILAALHGIPPRDERFKAFGELAPMIHLVPEAQKAHKSSRTKLPFDEWLAKQCRRGLTTPRLQGFVLSASLLRAEAERTFLRLYREEERRKRNGRK